MFVLFSVLVGESDEVSIKEAADAIIEAFDFQGEVKVSVFIANKLILYF